MKARVVRRSPTEAIIAAEAVAILQQHPDGGDTPLYPDAKKRALILARFADPEAKIPVPDLEVMRTAEALGTNRAIMGGHRALSPNIPSWSPTDEQRAWLERIADNPSEPGQKRAATLLLAAKQQMSSLGRNKANLAATLLRALRTGNALEEVVAKAPAGLLSAELSKIGHAPPPDPTHDEITQAIEAATTDKRRLACKIVLWALIDGEKTRDIAAKANVTMAHVHSCIHFARKEGMDHIAQHGPCIRRPARSKDCGRLAAIHADVAKAHADLTRELGRDPTVGEIMAVVSCSFSGISKIAKRMGLSLTRVKTKKAETKGAKP